MNKIFLDANIFFAAAGSKEGGSYEVMKKDPKPYAYAEYWECPRCYWRK